MFRLCLLGALAAAVATTPAGCGPGGSAPQLDPISDQVAYVGSEFTLQLKASDADLDLLRFTFSSNVPDLGDAAEINPYGDGSTAVFRWTPLASDQGTWSFDFSVTDGSSTRTETISIEVRTSVGEDGAPIFRSPLGTGTTLDLSLKPCLDLPIIVEDQDSNQVTITQEEPLIEGATLEQTAPFTAEWNWCPTAEQIEAQDRYAMLLAAADEEDHKTTKNFLVVLRKPPKPDCPGAPPDVAHTPMDVASLVGLTIDATVVDPEGLKSAPLLYYSTTPPATPPDVGAMTMTTMLLIDGDVRNGVWAADVPNPVAGMAMGATATVYYVIVAQDNDDAEGDCDHLTQAPASGTFAMTVTNPGGTGGLGLCEPCTADVQCGDAGDNCLLMGTGGEYYCFAGCASDAECPADYYCSISMMVSIDGAAANQCIPDSYTCGPPPPPACVDDAYEENDTRAMADAKPALPPGTYSLTSCDDGAFADDEDWFEITISGDAQVTASISGGAASDLDLSLVNATGTLIVKSDSTSSSESVSTCLVAGTYYLRVYAWDAVENDYSLTWSQTATSCGGTCEDDAEEPDDNYQSSRRVDDAYPHVSTTNAICSWDDDWYRVNLFSGETIYVSLTFTQSSVDEDLDLHLYKGTADLTPCDEVDPSTCSAAYGQSTDANEYLTFTVTESSYYYVVVHGWNGAENLYDICIGLSAADCPAP